MSIGYNNGRGKYGIRIPLGGRQKKRFWKPPAKPSLVACERCLKTMFESKAEEPKTVIWSVCVDCTKQKVKRMD